MANREVVRLNPQDARAHFFLGHALKELGTLENALECYSNAISLNADFAEAYVSMGVVLEYTGRFDWPPCPLTLPMLTMLPPPLSFITVAAPCIMRNGARMLSA